MNTIHAGTQDSSNRLDAAATLGRIAVSGRFTAALASLGLAYVLSWMELGLSLSIGLPGDGAAHPLAASVVSRALIGMLYLCVACHFQWARWLSVVLGIASVAVVAPMLATQWQVFPISAVVSGMALVCKLAASLFLMTPIPPRPHTAT